VAAGKSRRHDGLRSIGIFLNSGATVAAQLGPGRLIGPLASGIPAKLIDPQQ
jgi:hypothetical protein